MNERWQRIADYPDYEVSDQGQVRRCINLGRNAKKGGILKPYTRSSGYIEVSLYRNGEKTTCYVHRLVAQAFIPNPLHLPEVNHKKGKQKWNNTVNNLEWRTTAGNHLHASKTGLYGSRAGACFIAERGKWVATYSPTPSKVKFIGYFDSFVIAKAAHDAAVATIPHKL
jgi:hypothetical protein